MRFLDQGLAIKEFKLTSYCINFQNMSRDVDHWLKLASESNFGVLELCLPDDKYERDEECYIFPTGIIEVESLHKLVLTGAIRVDQAFQNHSVKYFSLRVLSLSLVPLRDEQAIEHLISCCPLLKSITLNCFYTTTTKSISILGLQKLKKVDVEGIQEVIIDAPNLEYFSFSRGVGGLPYKMNFDKCRNLRGLHLRSLHSSTITDKWFTDLFSKFPFLESLKFDNCIMSETINISSSELKVLELSECWNLKEVNVDAPNLLSCRYHGSLPIISFLKSSGQLVVNLSISINCTDFKNLMELIQNFKPQNVLTSLSLSIFPPIVDDELDFDVLQVSSTRPSIKKLHLRSVPNNKTFYLPLVNGLLLSCCPSTISLGLTFCSREFIEFFYETLTGTKEDECFCSSGHTKCWWHGLKGVKVSSSIKIDENVDFKTLLVALPTSCSEEDNISFRLEL